MNTPIVELSNVTKRYGADEVVRALSFSVERGECVGLLGPNGAGKTSTLRMMTGQAHISGGEIKLFGTPIQHRPRQVRARFGVVTQDDTLDEELTSYENLLVFASYFSVPRAEAHRRAEDLLEFVHLEDKRDVNIDKLSGGMRRRLLIARALVNAPDLVILDEPTTGLDPQARHLIWQKLRLLKRQGTT
ncbi:MAG: ABC transporter ATP-binding protein, partial [Chrysiogenetes bacterium]|nr:ABC transporter ATP-binding protein [Chrysiogenetes bacterium]